jgi:hypothetical protein
LLREVAVKIRKQNTDIENFAPLIRLYHVMKEKGLITATTGPESLELFSNMIESLTVSLGIFCFEQGSSIEEYASIISEVYSTASRFGITFDEFPSYISNQQKIINKLRKEIEILDNKRRLALKDHEMTLEILEEYDNYKPFIIQIQNRDKELAAKEEELANAKKELQQERFWKELEERPGWSIQERELDTLYIGLGYGHFNNRDVKQERFLTDFKEMVIDLFYHPSNYIQEIKEIKKKYDKEKRKEA